MGFYIGLSYPSILVMAGKYLAPERLEEEGRADVVILEGTNVVRIAAVKVGIEMISDGSAQRMVIVYHESNHEAACDGPEDYECFLMKRLEGMGFPNGTVKVIAVPGDHPITKSEAQAVLADLAKDGVRRAILLAKGFHTRRSYWAYKQVGLQLGIEIIPYPYFIRYQDKNWWKQREGRHSFISESFKFLYYLIEGYVPVKSLFAT